MNIRQKHTQISIGFILLATLVVMSMITLPISASPNSNGALDPTFGSDGKVTTDFGGYEKGHALAIQTDGKLLVAGYAAGQANDDFALVRYNNDGSLDSTFDTDGFVTTDLGSYDYGYALTIQGDGKIVVAGYSGSDNVDFTVVRYNNDGSLDTTFDMDGFVTTDLGSNDYGRALAIQDDGKIVVAGYSGTDNVDFALVRDNNDGSLDTTFDTDGKITTDFGGEDNGLALLIQADGKLLVAGYAAGQNNDDFALARYNADGSLDTTFDQDGFAINNLGANDYGYALAIQNDSKILVFGSSGTDFALTRYNADGSLDTTFDQDGFAVNDLGGNDYGYALVVQSDGKILAAGSSGSDFALVRYDSDGRLDTTFGNNAKVTTDFGGQDFGTALTIENDDKLIVAGYSSGNFALTRYTLTGDTPPTNRPTTTPTVPISTATPTGMPLPTATPTLVPSQTSTTALPDQQTSLTYHEANGSGISVQIPAGAVDEPTTLVYQSAPATNPPAAYQFVGHAFTLTAYQHDASIAHFIFGQPVTLTLSYLDEDLSGRDESQLQLLTLDVATGQWSTNGITIIERHPQDNKLVVTLAHLTKFALTVPQNKLFLPLVTRGRP